MAKIAGMGFTVAVDDAAGDAQTITNDILSMSIKTSRGEQDVTGLDSSALERLLLLGDAEVTFTFAFNATADCSHDVFKAIGTIFAGEVGRTVTITFPGAVASLAMEMVFVNYDIERGSDCSLVCTSTGKLADGTVPTYA